MSNNSKESRGGMGFCRWLGLLFIALKLTGHIDWSWWLVLSPLWVAFIFTVLKEIYNDTFDEKWSTILQQAIFRDR